MNAHQSLSQQKGSAQAYNAETHGGAIKTAESMGRVSNALALRGHAASVDAAGNESLLVSANAHSAMERARDAVAYHIGKQMEDKENGIEASADARGFAKADSHATIGAMQRAVAAGAGQNVKDSNFEKSVLAAGKKVAGEANQSAMQDFGKSYLNPKLVESSPELKKASSELTSITNKPLEARDDENFSYTQEDTKRIGELQNTIRKEGQVAANILKYGKSEGGKINNINQGIASGDAIATAATMSVDQHSLGLGGSVGSFSTTSTGGIQGGIQSGVSFSHNESRNYSYGTNMSGGNALAGIAEQHRIYTQSLSRDYKQTRKP